MLCGGVGEDQIATEGHEIHEVCNAVRKMKVVRNKRSRYSYLNLMLKANLTFIYSYHR